MYPAVIAKPNTIPSRIIITRCCLEIIGSESFDGFRFIMSLSAESVLTPTPGKVSITTFDHKSCNGINGTG
jgi:hypothetical protein